MSAPNQLPAAEHLRAAFRVSAASVVWTVTSSSSAIVAGILAHSLVLIVFGLAGALDAAGSSALVLHFRHAIKHQAVSTKKERRALSVVTFGLIAIGLFTIEESTRRLLTGSEPHSSVFGIVISAASAMALGALAFRKRTVAGRVHSTALLADSWLSATGAALALIAVAGTALGPTLHASWVDPVSALLVAVLAAATGVGFIRREATSLEKEGPD